MKLYRIIIALVILLVTTGLGFWLWPRQDGPRAYINEDEGDDVLTCDNGIWRVRATSGGIMWFDFYHPGEEKWYINKNNLDLIAVTTDDVIANSELDEMPIRTELISQDENSLRMNYYYLFENNAHVRVELTLNRNDPLLHFKFYTEKNSVRIKQFIVNITFGQAEAVEEVTLGGNTFQTGDYTMPLPGDSLELQQMEYFNDLDDLEILFHGSESEKRDPNNPIWMSRYLGLQQYIKVEEPLRKIFNDQIAFELRDTPWQPDWKTPTKVPWFEAIWIIRNGHFLDGDGLTYGITNYEDYE